mgnify:CR=1 FL=1
MIVEQHVNGKIELWLKPETPIEQVFISEMLTRAEKGQSVTLSGNNEKLIVAVEQ